MLNFWGQNQRFQTWLEQNSCCVHAYFRINVVSKRWFKTPKNVRLRSWLEQNADSGGSMNAKSHITMFKWRHINAFPVHLSSNNSLEQCAVHAHEIVFFSREAWTVLPWRAFWISVSKRWFCLRKISMNAAQKCAFTIVVRAKRWFWWKHERKITYNHV